MNLKFYLSLAIFFMLMSILSSYAQVTIGSGLEPNDGSLLQLKEIEPEEAGKENSNKGFNLPRVSLIDGNNLYPMFLKDPKNPLSGPSDTYSTPEGKTKIDLQHRGLMVYNINNTPPFIEGLYTWNGATWKYSDGISPWFDTETATPAVENNHDVYLAGTVTIGKEITEEENADGALLQLAERVRIKRAVKGPQHNAYRGFALPRVNLTDKNELYPMFLTNPELPYNETASVGDPKYNPEKDEYKNGKASLKASHTGLSFSI